MPAGQVVQPVQLVLPGVFPREASAAVDGRVARLRYTALDCRRTRLTSSARQGE